jgi:hypothetical protein
MIKNTGKTTLERTRASGVLSDYELELFTILCEQPGLTAGEVFSVFLKQNPNTRRSRNEVAKRISDFKAWGAVRNGEMALCKYSGVNARALFVTGEVPDKKRTQNRGHINENETPVSLVPVVQAPAKLSPLLSSLAVIDADRQDAIQVLINLRAQSRRLSFMTRILSLIPGLRRKNDEVTKALDIAIGALYERN